MRLYAFLLFALFALAARAATIPEKVDVVEKKITENTDKAPENVSSEQELVDQANTINDVDNKLRTKPAVIPVEVVVEKQPLDDVDLDETDEIVRPVVDLRNPGPPQRQEHETQNPESFGTEQQIVQFYKQNLNQAQATLKSVSENVQNMLQNNEQINFIQQSIQNLREGFIAQINNLNSTVQHFLHADNSNTVTPAVEETKANVQVVESGLTALKNDFEKEIETLTDGVQVFAALRAEGDKPEENNPSSGAAPAPAPVNPAPAGPGNIFITFITGMQDRFQSGMTNLTNTMNGIVTQAQSQGLGSFFTQAPGQASTAAPASGYAPAGAQSDSQAPTTAPPFFFGIGQQPNPFASFFSSVQNFFSGGQQNTPSTAPAPAPATAPVVSEAAAPVKPSEDKEPAAAQPAAEPQAAPVTPIGPIRQILQNNPISQGIASAVQRLQNINNPEKPREPEKEKEQAEKKKDEPEKEKEEPAKVDDKPKGHRPAVGDNNNSDGSRVEESEPAKEVQKETIVPETQEIKKEEATVQKTDEVVVKTE